MRAMRLFVCLAIYALVILTLSGPIAAQDQKTKASTPAKQAVVPVSPAKNISNELTVEQVIQLVQAGLGEDLIIAKIRKNGKPFDLNTNELVQLKKAGASDNIIKALMDPQAQLTSLVPLATAVVVPPSAPPEVVKVIEKPTVPETKTEPKPEPKEIAPPMNTEDFKRLLKQRYDQKTLTVMVSGLTAGEFKKAFAGLGQGDAGLMWYHYQENIPVPNRQRSNPLKLLGKKASDMEQLDARTFADLESGLNISQIQRGEVFKVNKYYCEFDYVQLDMVVTNLSHLKDIDVQKASKETTTAVRGNEVRQTVRVGTFGVRFKFFFDKNTTIKNNDYQTIVAEIDKYFLPKEEAEKIFNSEQNVEIEPGATEEAVIQKLGPPLKSLKAGNQKSLKYKDMTIILRDGKVAEVKLD